MSIDGNIELNVIGIDKIKKVPYSKIEPFVPSSLLDCKSHQKSSSFNNRDENGLRFNENGNYCVAHPTTKPLLVPSRAIKNSSKENNTILDLFGGSGSTLIACEQLNRKCYMMELDEHYVSVIIERYINFTGNDVYRINPDGTKTNWKEIIT